VVVLLNQIKVAFLNRKGENWPLERSKGGLHVVLLVQAKDGFHVITRGGLEEGAWVQAMALKWSIGGLQ
jgi:hypothetical protein